MVAPGTAPSGTVMTTFSAIPGIVSFSFEPGIVFGGTSSSYCFSSSVTVRGATAGGAEVCGTTGAEVEPPSTATIFLVLPAPTSFFILEPIFFMAPLSP